MDVCVGFGIWAPRSDLESRISGLKVNNWWGVWVHSCVFGRFMVKCFCFVHLELQLFRMQSGCCLSGFRCQLRSLWTRMNSLAACCTCIFPILQEGFQYCAVGLGFRCVPAADGTQPSWIFMFFKFSTQMQHHQNFYSVSENPGRNRTKSTSITLRNLRVWRDLKGSEGIWFCWCTCCTARLGPKLPEGLQGYWPGRRKAIGVKICYNILAYQTMFATD